jgi:predicted SAM-dependent methyltransferase
LENVDIVHDLLGFPYPFEKESFDKIYLRHVIEHFNFDQINQIFLECNRLMKDDGEVIITVPHVFSISAFIDPTHQSYFTFGSGHFWDKQHSKSYYKPLKTNWQLLQTSCKVVWFDWKRYQMKKLDSFLSNIIKKRLNKAIKSITNPCKADRIVKKSSFHFVEIKWVFRK